jgi:hypothetical protein
MRLRKLLRVHILVHFTRMQSTSCEAGFHLLLTICPYFIRILLRVSNVGHCLSETDVLRKGSFLNVGESQPGDEELLGAAPEEEARDTWMTELPPERQVRGRRLVGESYIGATRQFISAKMPSRSTVMCHLFEEGVGIERGAPTYDS